MSSSNDEYQNPFGYSFVDIGANLMDERYTCGSYRGKVRHEADFQSVVDRAARVGVKHLILTAGTLDESRKAVAHVRQWRKDNNQENAAKTNCQLHCTVGVHPTRCMEFVESINDEDEKETVDDEQHLQELIEIAKDGMQDGIVVAVGEMGLDYDRLEFCPRDVQRTYFQKQLQLAQATGLPLFLHNRNVDTELYDLLSQHKSLWSGGGVVHSFDDSSELAHKMINDLGLYIGLNGCSLRTEENLRVVKDLPLNRILLETDCPYCDIKRTHASYQYVQTHFETKPEKKYQANLQVKGRNEPCNIIQVAEVVAGVKGIPVQEVMQQVYENSLQLYGWKE